MRKYCAMDYVFLVTIKGRAQSSDPEWSQFRVEVDKPYKKPPRGKKASRGLRLRRGKKTIISDDFITLSRMHELKFELQGMKSKA